MLLTVQLPDYLGRKIGVRVPHPTDDYGDIGDEPLEAAEDDDS